MAASSILQRKYKAIAVFIYFWKTLSLGEYEIFLFIFRLIYLPLCKNCFNSCNHVTMISVGVARQSFHQCQRPRVTSYASPMAQHGTHVGFKKIKSVASISQYFTPKPPWIISITPISPSLHRPVHMVRTGCLTSFLTAQAKSPFPSAIFTH